MSQPSNPYGSPNPYGATPGGVPQPGQQQPGQPQHGGPQPAPQSAPAPPTPSSAAGPQSASQAGPYQQPSPYGSPSPYGAPGQGAAPAGPARPGLFDFSFHALASPRLAKTGYIMLLVLVGFSALSLLISGIGDFVTAVRFAGYSEYGDVLGTGAGTWVMSGLRDVILAPLVAIAGLYASRFLVETAVGTARAAEKAEAASSGGAEQH